MKLRVQKCLFSLKNQKNSHFLAFSWSLEPLQNAPKWPFLVTFWGPFSSRFAVKWPIFLKIITYFKKHPFLSKMGPAASFSKNAIFGQFYCKSRWKLGPKIVIFAKKCHFFGPFLGSKIAFFRKSSKKSDFFSVFGPQLCEGIAPKPMRLGPCATGPIFRVIF